MTPVSDKDRLLGDYRLKQLVLETPLAYRWLAEQESVGRMVLVDELKPEQIGQRALFLENVRAKAAMKHPLVASVYEAVDGDEECFFAHEYLSGGTLESRIEAGESMKPTQLAHVLRRIAEVCQQYETGGQATSPMSLEHLHYDAQGVLQLDNLIKAGERGKQETARDMGFLGRTLLPLVGDGQPGTTRLQTLLMWMRGEVLEQPLTWAQVIDLCVLIEKQLNDPEALQPAKPTLASSKNPMALILIVGVLALAVVLVVALRMRPEKSGPVVVPRVDLPMPIAVPAVTLRPMNGGEVPVAAFRIQAHEVTIDEYAGFLRALKVLAANDKGKALDHPEQPDDKTSHMPANWEQMHATAEAGGIWQGRPVTLDAPVVGVDWWDAWAFAKWIDGRLPTELEWLAALGVSPDEAVTIEAAAWGPVDPATADRSKLGVLNLAGSVCEWLGEPSTSPADPTGDQKWVLAGGSYLQSGSHAMSREWVADRSLRRPDIGFRVVFPETD